jgi:PAS domain S-box-containing protein
MSHQTQSLATAGVSSPGSDAQDILDHAPIGIFKTTPEGQFLYANQALAEMYGYATPRDLIDSVKDISKELFSDPKEGPAIIQLLASEGLVKNHESEQIRKDGSGFWTSGSIRTIYAEGGSVSHYQGFVTDITERKRAEEALHEEKAFQTILLDLAAGFINVPPTEFDRAINDMLEKIGEFTNLDRVYLFLHDHLRRVTSNTHEWCRAGVKPEIDNLQDIPFDYFSDMLQTWEKGKLVYISSVLQMPNEHAMRSILLQQGIQSLIMLPLLRDQVNTGFVGFDAVNECKSFSEREIALLRVLAEIISNAFAHRDAHKALRESEARFRSLFEYTPSISVQGYDASRRVIFWNYASEKLYGYSQGEALGQRLEDLIIPDEMCQGVIDAISNWLAGGPAIPAEELVLRRKDGTAVPVFSSHALQNGPNGPEMFCIDIDLTELKETEQALIQAKEAAEAANRTKSEFLSTMSHELRTPFNGIMGMMQLLQTTPLNAEQKHFVAMAITASDRYARLLTDLLEISTIEAGSMLIQEAEFCLKELCASVHDLFKATAMEKGVDLRCSLDLSTPANLIGDVMRVKQILFNLVGNALKFTDQGLVNVEMTPLSSPKEQIARILFSVSDTGIGIPEDKLNLLFKPFVQVDGSYTRKYQGAGLGLAIVRRMVELMGGNISVESCLSEGTTVHVTLPFRRPGDVSL